MPSAWTTMILVQTKALGDTQDTMIIYHQETRQYSFLLKQSHMEPERGFEPGVALKEAAALPFEPSHISLAHINLKNIVTKQVFYRTNFSVK